MHPQEQRRITPIGLWKHVMGPLVNLLCPLDGEAGYLARMSILAALLLLTLPALASPPTFDEVKAELDQPIEPRGTGSCPAPEQFSMTRPDPPGTPTVVGLAALFQDISALNDIDQTITAD